MKSKVYEVAIKSPLTPGPKLSAELENQVYLKREDLQPVNSFKLRGAYNKIVGLSEQEKDKGVIAASAGNHAQGVALSAQKLGLSAVIVMPTTTPEIKVSAVKSYGAEVVLHGDSYSDAYEHSMELVDHSGRTFIHPFDDPLVIAGQGTIGSEIIEQLPSVTHIFVPVGGGGLIAGIAQAVKQSHPTVKIIGVEPTDSNAMQASLQAGKRVILPHVGIFADGVAVKQIGELTYDLTKKYVDEIMTVNTDQICAAIKQVFEETRSIVEPAGALAAAGLKAYATEHQLQDQQLVAICSGANMSFERLQFIAERTLVGSGREALFAVTLPERSGALQHFCEVVMNGHNITEFNYRLNRREQANIFVGISITDAADKQKFMDTMHKNDYQHVDLSADDLAKEHIRHMIGGPSPEAHNERLYEITFPDRPNALAEFLKHLVGQRDGARTTHQPTGTNNISLFHYRGQGGDQGRVLIGFEASDQKALEAIFTQSQIEFKAVDSPAAAIFLT